jgi:hypothetical protein
MYEGADFWHTLHPPANTRTQLSGWFAHGSRIMEGTLDP